MTVVSLSFGTAAQASTAEATSVISPEVVSSYSKTVYRTYSSLGSIPSSISYVEYKDGYRYQGTLRFVTYTSSGGTYTAKFSGTMYLQ